MYNSEAHGSSGGGVVGILHPEPADFQPGSHWVTAPIDHVFFAFFYSGLVVNEGNIDIHLH